MTTKQVIRVLKKARNLIAKGWTQGPLETRIGRRKAYCAWGAVCKALGLSASSLMTGDFDVMRALASDRTLRASNTRLGGCAFTSRHLIINFNEHPDRKQSQVVALFDRTIARLEKQLA